MKKMILLCALCLFGAGVVFGQAYSDLLYRDWAGLRAYAQVNKTLGDVRPDVVFMGNSITEGWFNQHPEFFQKNNFLGRGIGGQTSSETGTSPWKIPTRTSFRCASWHASTG